MNFSANFNKSPINLDPLARQIPHDHKSFIQQKTKEQSFSNNLTPEKRRNFLFSQANLNPEKQNTKPTESDEDIRNFALKISTRYRRGGNMMPKKNNKQKTENLLHSGSIEAQLRHDRRLVNNFLFN